MDMTQDLEKLLREQLTRVSKAVATATGNTGIDTSACSSVDKQELCGAQAEIIAEYAEILEKREKELFEELRRAILYYGGKIAATQTLLRQLGGDEQRMLNIKSVLRSEDMKEIREKSRI